MDERVVRIAMVGVWMALGSGGCGGGQHTAAEGNPDAPLTARVALECKDHAAGAPVDEDAPVPRRIRGSTTIQLREPALVRLHNARQNEVAVTIVYCVDARGEVSCIDFGGNDRPRDIAQSTIDGVQSWAFEPLVMNGAAVPFCRTFTAHYHIM